jgi:hypothetical protein
VAALGPETSNDRNRMWRSFVFNIGFMTPAPANTSNRGDKQKSASSEELFPFAQSFRPAFG